MLYPCISWHGHGHGHRRGRMQRKSGRAGRQGGLGGREASVPRAGEVSLSPRSLPHFLLRHMARRGCWEDGIRPPAHPPICQSHRRMECCHGDWCQAARLPARLPARLSACCTRAGPWQSGRERHTAGMLQGALVSFSRCSLFLFLFFLCLFYVAVSMVELQVFRIRYAGGFVSGFFFSAGVCAWGICGANPC